MLGFRQFGDPQLERLYRHQQLHHHSTLLVYVLCVFTAALLLVALNHLPNPDMTLLLATISAACALALNILLNIHQSATGQHRTVVAISCWLGLTMVCMLPAGGQLALLPVIIASFTLYTLFPFGILSTAAIGSTLSLAQVIFFILLSNQPVFSLDQLLATILVHLWSHFIGVYLYSTRNRLCRAAFLNARNAISSQHEAVQENVKMATLLSSALPSHVISSVQNQLGVPNAPKIYVEHYGQVSVVYAKLYGLQIILNQISVQDSARLLNEFNNRIDQLVKMHGFIRIQSDAIVVVSGSPQCREDHALSACHFSRDLITLFRSFCDATAADLQLKVGIGSGSISSGIIGARKWHYDIIGMAFDNAKNLEMKATLGSIRISEDTKRLVERDFATERIDYGSWCLLHVLSSPSSIVYSSAKLPVSLLFPASQRRFSLVTLPQAINRILQSSSFPAPNETLKPNSNNNTQPGRRKKKLVADYPLCEKFDDEDVGDDGLMKLFSMKFLDDQLEKSFHAQMDRWFIPALAISILFLVIYGLYQVLVMPRLISTLALIVLALAIMFVILLVLYINYFESFCHFITRTSAGHSVAILLIIVVLFLCGIVNTFSCPSFSASPVCHVVHYSMISCAIWMLTTTVFLRFSSLYLFFTLMCAVLVYSIHVFATHSDLYVHFSIAVGWRIEFDLLIGLVTLAMLIFLQSRWSERMIRLDYLSILKSVDVNHQLERFESLNEQILLNALPTHIAYNYGLRSDPYQHLCHSVGVLSAKFGNGSDWQGEFGFDRLNRIVFEVDQLIEVHTGLEKVRSSHCIYTVAVGVLPEISKNVNDAPFTIGDLLASLTSFASKIKQIADNEGVDIAIGIDCGSALSLVIGMDRPRYDVIGVPCTRAAKLMEATDQMIGKKENCTMVSEEIFLALRPRSNFYFDERNPVTVGPGLVGYVLLENSSQKRAPKRLGNAVPPPAPRSQLKEEVAAGGSSALPLLPSNEVHSEAAESSAESATDFDDNEEGQGGSGNHRFIDDNAFVSEERDNTQSTTLPMDKSQCSLVLPSDLQALANDSRINGYHNHRQFPSNAATNNGSGASRNPLEMFGSMNSSFSSDMCSIDVSVETDSEMEWITPEMIANNSDYRANYGGLPVKNIVRNHRRHLASGSSVPYKGDRARQYSDFSESERIAPGSCSSRMRRKRYRPSLSRNGPKLPSWLSSRTSFNSELSVPHSQAGSISALDRLNAAARRVDKMLQELAVVDDTSTPPDCAPFPTANGNAQQQHSKQSARSTNNNNNSVSKREMSSACHTEYDNAESEGGACSDPEINKASVGLLEHSRSRRSENARHQRRYPGRTQKISEFPPSLKAIDHIKSISSIHFSGKLEELKRALIGSKSSRDNQQYSNSKQNSHAKPNRLHSNQRQGVSAMPVQQEHPNPIDGSASNSNLRRCDNGSEADIDSNCSSLASSMMFDKLRWKSVHSIGYDNEYEFASDNEEEEIDIHSSAATELSGILGSGGEHAGAFAPNDLAGQSFVPMDAENEEEVEVLEGKSGFRVYKPKSHRNNEILDARGQVHQLSKDIRRNFGDYQLATFSDVE